MKKAILAICGLLLLVGQVSANDYSEANVGTTARLIAKTLKVSDYDDIIEILYAYAVAKSDPDYTLKSLVNINDRTVIQTLALSNETQTEAERERKFAQDYGEYQALYAIFLAKGQSDHIRSVIKGDLPKDPISLAADYKVYLRGWDPNFPSNKDEQDEFYRTHISALWLIFTQIWLATEPKRALPFVVDGIDATLQIRDHNTKVFLLVDWLDLATYLSDEQRQRCVKELAKLSNSQDDDCKQSAKKALLYGDIVRAYTLVKPLDLNAGVVISLDDSFLNLSPKESEAISLNLKPLCPQVIELAGSPRSQDRQTAVKFSEMLAKVGLKDDARKCWEKYGEAEDKSSDLEVATHALMPLKEGFDDSDQLFRKSLVDLLGSPSALIAYLISLAGEGVQLSSSQVDFADSNIAQSKLDDLGKASLLNVLAYTASGERRKSILAEAEALSLKPAEQEWRYYETSTLAVAHFDTATAQKFLDKLESVMPSDIDRKQIVSEMIHFMTSTMRGLGNPPGGNSPVF